MFLPADKFQLLLAYLDAVGVDRIHVLRSAGLTGSNIDGLDPDALLPASHYSRLYTCSVKSLQRIDSQVPWAAGLGTDAFEMLCRSIIGSGSLSEALDRAQRFSKVLEPVTGSYVSIVPEDGTIGFHFHWTAQQVTNLFAPDNWYRSSSADSVILASGLLIWHGLLSWLIGHQLSLARVEVAAASVSERYSTALASALGAPVDFHAEKTCLVFPSSALDCRVVQSHDSLQSFLDETVVQLIRIEQQPASVSDAVKRLLGTDFSSGVRPFSEVAESLHMSESSLRRRLLEEQTSFQVLKDEVRCSLAKRYLKDPDQRIGEVADRLGFTEQSSFGRSFRQWTGMSPKAWREAEWDTDSSVDPERGCSKT